jgi:hypothetical protein
MSLTVRRLTVDPNDGHRDICGGHGLQDFATGDEAIEQTVGCALRFVMGEWFLDADEGVPWYPQPNASTRTILASFPADLGYAEALIKAAILGVPGVVSITSFAMNFDHNTRAATCTVDGVTEDGGTFTVAESIP